MDFKIIFCDINTKFAASYASHLKQFTNTSFYQGSFVDLDGQFDCIVSPGNSFCLFDGGFDGAIKKYFSEIDQFTVIMQRQLLAECGGYQQPGTCVLLETGDAKCPYVAHAPTMVTPTEITDLSIIYHAMWSTLIEIHKYNRDHPDEKKIKSLLCPGLGCGVGGLDSATVSKLMSLALSDYSEFVRDTAQTDPKYLITWNAATKRSSRLANLIDSFDNNDFETFGPPYDVI